MSLYVGYIGAGLFLAGALFFEVITGVYTISGTPFNMLPVILAVLLIACLRAFANKNAFSYVLFLMFSLLSGALTFARLPNAALLVGLVYGFMISVLGYGFYHSRKKTMLPDIQ